MKSPKRTDKTDKTLEDPPPLDMGLFIESWEPVDRDAPRLPWGIEDPPGLAEEIAAAVPTIAAFMAAREALTEHRPLPDLAKDGTPAEITAAGKAHEAHRLALLAVRGQVDAWPIARRLIRFWAEWERRDTPTAAFRAAWELAEAWLLWGNAEYARRGRYPLRKANEAKRAKRQAEGPTVRKSPLRDAVEEAYAKWKAKPKPEPERNFSRRNFAKWIKGAPPAPPPLSKFFEWLREEGEGLDCDGERVWLEGDDNKPRGRTIRAVREWLK